MMMLPSEAKTETMPEAVLVASRFGMARKLTVALARGECTQAEQIPYRSQDNSMHLREEHGGLFEFFMRKIVSLKLAGEIGLTMSRKS